MADDQEQQRREEHWKELASLLGIEPGAPAPSKRPDAEPIREERAQERPAPQPRREPEPKPREPAPRIFEEVETPHEEAGAAIVDTSMERDEPRGPQQQSSEREEGHGQRGGKRRRGRGRGGDRKDDSRHRPYQRQRDEAPRPAEPEQAFDRPIEEPEAGDSPIERKPVRAERFAVEEPAEEAGDELLDQPIPVDDDDEIDEEDAPADWNVITWSELIASLKRFDR